jgi:hypothetical protein
MRFADFGADEKLLALSRHRATVWPAYVFPTPEGGAICGGSVLRRLLGNPTPKADIDIFFWKKDAYDTYLTGLTENLKAKKLGPSDPKKQASDYDDKGARARTVLQMPDGFKLDVVCKDGDNLKNILDNFDLSISQVAMQTPFEILMTERAAVDLMARRGTVLRYTPTTKERISKFKADLGFEFYEDT